MKKAEARELLKRLGGHAINGFSLVRPIGTGATAAVYEASNDRGEVVAVKIYDAQFADEERLQRELILKGHDCPNLVKVIDGGRNHIEGTDLLFLVMEHVEGPELTKLRDRKTPTTDHELRRLLLELCTACAFLLERGLCHRDIKPQNIKLRENGQLVLLDMGVLRPVGDSDLTQEGRNIATRRYSPPELQHRREQADPAGLEALTVYQVGAVLFELIQRTRLFAAVPDHPDATLSRAIDTEIPRFVGATAAPDLCEVALRCLAKSWMQRPTLQQLIAVADFTPTQTDSAISRRLQLARQSSAEIAATQAEAEAHLTSVHDAFNAARTAVEQAMRIDELPAPTVEVLNTVRGQLWVVATFPQSMEAALATRLLILVSLKSRPSDSAILTRGCGLYGQHFMPSAKQVPQAFGGPAKAPRSVSTQQADAMWESLWDLPFDAETFGRKIAGWVKTMIEAYMIQTEEFYETLVAHMKEEAKARQQGAHLRSFPRAPSNLFNTQGASPLGNRQWK